LFEGGLSNLYEYCNNDPVNYVDLDGLQKINIKRIKDILNKITEGKYAYDTINGNYKTINRISKLDLDKYTIQTIDKSTIQLIDIHINSGNRMKEIHPFYLNLAMQEYNKAFELLEKYLSQKENLECYKEQIKKQKEKGFWNWLLDLF